MKVLGISGSPRLGGNTDTLLQEVLRGAESRGADTETVFICDRQIAPCEHCDNCLVLGDCKIPDDMHDIYRQMSEADAVVIASPIHFLGLTAQLKAAVDRCQALWARKYQLKISPLEEERKRRGLFVSTGGRTAAGNFEPAIATVKALFAVLDVEYVGALTFSGVDKKGEILKNEDALKQAYEAGVKLAT